MTTGKIWLALALIMAPAYAATIEGPRLGVVFDAATKSLRPILGIPGAAILAEPLEPRLDLRKTAVSPMQDYVLATEGEHNQVVVLNVGRLPLQAVPVPGAGRGPDQIVLSSGGGVAALYYKETNRIQVFSGLPGAPKSTAELFLSAGQTPSALGAGEDGTVLAAVGSSVYWVSPRGEVPILTGLHKVASISLSANQTALIADSAANQIHRVRNVTGTVEADVLVGPEDGVAAPVAVAASHDNQRAFVANGKTGTIVILDLSGKTAATKLSCGCTVTGLDRLAGNDVFRLTEPSARPMWVLEAAAHQSRILFVPDDLSRSGQK